MLTELYKVDILIGRHFYVMAQKVMIGGLFSISGRSAKQDNF